MAGVRLSSVATLDSALTSNWSISSPIGALASVISSFVPASNPVFSTIAKTDMWNSRCLDVGPIPTREIQYQPMTANNVTVNKIVGSQLGSDTIAVTYLEHRFHVLSILLENWLQCISNSRSQVRVKDFNSIYSNGFVLSEVNPSTSLPIASYKFDRLRPLSVSPAQPTNDPALKTVQVVFKYDDYTLIP